MSVALFPCRVCEEPGELDGEGLCAECSTASAPEPDRQPPCFKCCAPERLERHSICAACHVPWRCHVCNPWISQVPSGAEHTATYMRPRNARGVPFD